jgi:hypothetical protein
MESLKTAHEFAYEKAGGGRGAPAACRVREKGRTNLQEHTRLKVVRANPDCAPLAQPFSRLATVKITTRA